MAEIKLEKYGITDAKEIIYNPSYELLFEEEMKPELTELSEAVKNGTKLMEKKGFMDKDSIGEY